MAKLFYQPDKVADKTNTDRRDRKGVGKKANKILSHYFSIQY